MKKNFIRLVTAMLAVIMICGLTVAPAYAREMSELTDQEWLAVMRGRPEPGQPLESYSNSFVDVQPGDPYYDAVMVIAEGGLMGGYGDGTFGPDDILTYGQFMTVMARLSGGVFLLP